MYRLPPLGILGIALLMAVLLAACTATPTATPAPPTTTTSEASTPTPAAATTPTPAASLTPTTATAATAAPTLAPTVSPTGPAPTPTSLTAACPAQSVRGFGLVYGREKVVSDRLRCPLVAEAAIDMTVQKFENGVMLQWSGSPEIIVLRADGSWAPHPSTWKGGDAIASAGTPPQGLQAPRSAFGKLWSENASIQEALGWAITEQQGVTGAIQNYAGGRMLWTPDSVIHVLYNEQTWQRFADEFVG